MAILSNHNILELCKRTPPLIEGYINIDWQLQPSGFDLTINSIFVLDSAGTINKVPGNNILPKRTEVSCDAQGLYELSKGYYVVQFNEVLCFPNNIMGLAHTRSTLIRYGGTLITGVWDPGFHGRSQCGLLITNDYGIKIAKDSMLMQMTFHLLSQDSSGFQYNEFYKNADGTIG